MKTITMTIEQDGNKVIFTLTLNDGRTDVKVDWLPPLDKKHPQEKDLLAMKLLGALKDC